MAGTFFLDTNIFVYAYGGLDSGQDDEKQKAALHLIRRAHSEDGAISSQVVQEFCNVMLTKFEKPVLAEDADKLLQAVLKPIWRHAPNMEFYRRAVRLRAANQLNFYDALIIQAALDLDCRVLYSEDLQTGRRFGKLVVKNPFTDHD